MHCFVSKTNIVNHNCRVDYYLRGEKTNDIKQQILWVGGEKDCVKKHDEWTRWLSEDLGNVVWSIEMRGFGLSGRVQKAATSIPCDLNPHSLYVDSFDDYISDIEQLLMEERKKHLTKGFNDPVVIIAISSMGLVACEFAKLFPHLVSQVILISPSFIIRENLIKVENNESSLTYDNTSILSSTHSKKKLLEWISIQKKYPSCIINDVSSQYKKAYEEATKQFLNVNKLYSHLNIKMLILQAGSDENAIVSLQDKFQQASLSNRFLRSYDGCFYDLLNEIDPITADIRNQIDIFIANDGSKGKLASNSHFCGIVEDKVSKTLVKKEENKSLFSSIDYFVTNVLPKIQKLLALADFRDKYSKLFQYFCKLFSTLHSQKSIVIPAKLLKRMKAFLSLVSTSRRFLWCGRVITLPIDIKEALEGETLLDKILLMISAIFGFCTNSIDDTETLMRFGFLKKGTLSEGFMEWGVILWFYSSIIDIYYGWIELLHLKSTVKGMHENCSSVIQTVHAKSNSDIIDISAIHKKISDQERKLLIQYISFVKLVCDSIFAFLSAQKMEGRKASLVSIFSALSSAICGLLKHLYKVDLL